MNLDTEVNFNPIKLFACSAGFIFIVGIIFWGTMHAAITLAALTILIQFLGAYLFVKSSLTKRANDENKA